MKMTAALIGIALILGASAAAPTPHPVWGQVGAIATAAAMVAVAVITHRSRTETKAAKSDVAAVREAIGQPNGRGDMARMLGDILAGQEAIKATQDEMATTLDQHRQAIERNTSDVSSLLQLAVDQSQQMADMKHADNAEHARLARMIARLNARMGVEPTMEDHAA